MRWVGWLGFAVFTATVAVGCGISPNGEMSAPVGDDGGASSSGSSGGSSGGSGSSSGGVADAHQDGKNGGDGSTGGGDTGVDSAGDVTMNDAPRMDAPPEAPPPDSPQCVTAGDCPAGYACEPNGTCDTVCSSTIQCNLGCCDTNGRCSQTGNSSCNSGQQCTTCQCNMASDCPQHWACNMNGNCSQSCDAMNLCNGGCCSDVNMGTCVTDCSAAPEGPVCNNKGFCGCNSNSDCSSAGYGPDCMGMPAGAGNGCQCHENGGSNTGDCTGSCTICNAMPGLPTRCHC